MITPSQQAWVAKLMQFEFEIRYKKGKENGVVDALSRVPHLRLDNLITFILSAELLSKIEEVWKQDEQLEAIIVAKESDPNIRSHYTWHNGLLRRKGKLVIDGNSQLQQQLIAMCYDSLI